MPTYEFECIPCQALDEMVLTIAGRDLEQPCPSCGQPMKRLCGVAPAIGALWSKPITVGGRRFETNAAFRAANHKNEAQGFSLASKSDSGFRQNMDELRELRESTAKRQGYAGEGERQEAYRKRRAKRG